MLPNTFDPDQQINSYKLLKKLTPHDLHQNHLGTIYANRYT